MKLVMKLLQWLLIGLAAVSALAVLVGQLGLLQGTRPDDLGVHDGRLKPPSATPNSVSSQALLWSKHKQQHEQAQLAQIAPLPVHGDGLASIARLQVLLQADPAVTVVESRSNYLYAQYTSPLMKFVDDVEFWYDARNGVIQVRSASRLGRNDFGANRRRIEALREQLAAS